MLRYAIMSLLGIGVITLSPSAQAADARSTGDTLEEVVVVFARGEALIARD